MYSGIIETLNGRKKWQQLRKIGKDLAKGNKMQKKQELTSK